MNLSDRLMKIAGFVKEDTSVLDIGTDHGYIPIYLVKRGISKKVIASDISLKTLNNTVERIKSRSLDKSISCRLGNGLEVIQPFEVDGVIIAGMGGILIQEILEKNKTITDSIDYFIFQPMVASKELRKYLIKNNFKIIDEKLSKENNKFYEIIYVKKGKDELREEIYYEISERLIEKKDPLLKEFVENKINSTKLIMDTLEDEKSKKNIGRYNELKKSLGEYMEVLKRIET